MYRFRRFVVVVAVLVPVLLSGGSVSADPPPGDAFQGLVPARLMDTRVGGSTVDDLFEGGGAVGPGSVTSVTIAGRGGVPSFGVGAVALNVTAVSSASTYVTVWPAGASQPNASNLNLQAGVTTPNMVIVALGAGGQVSLFNESGNTQLLVDVLGWFPTGASFTGLVPARLMDTRAGGATVDDLFEGTGAVGPASVTNVTILNRGGVPASGVGAVALNVTATGPTANSYVTVWPAGAAQPNASNLNLLAGVTTPNMVIVAVGAGGQISLFNESGNTNLIVDVLGWFPTGESFSGLVPGRLLDTRSGGSTVDDLFEGGGAVGPASVTNVTISNRGGVPSSGVGAVALNVTATAPSATSYVTVWPAGAAQPNASNLNLRAGVTTPNMVIVALGAGGQISLFNEAGTTDLIVDVLGWFPTTFEAGAATSRVSIRSDGTQAVGGNSSEPAISADGRYIAFASLAPNLIVGDLNAERDVFLRDTVLDTTIRISVDSAGIESSGGGSEGPTISADGRYVAYTSTSNTLLGVGGDGNSQADIFLYDRLNGQTTRVSVSDSEAESNGPSTSPSISSDGRFITFSSVATNLVTGDSAGQTDIFVRDTLMQTTTRVNVSSSGAQATDGGSFMPAISGDGRYVTYHSYAINLVTGDTNSNWDIFLYDRTLATTIRVTVDGSGNQVAFGGFNPSISDDGRYIAYESSNTELVVGDTNNSYDIFVYDRVLAATTRVSVSSAGVPNGDNEDSDFAEISGNGRYVAYRSEGSTLVAGDGNTFRDVYVFDRETSETTRVTVDTGGLDPDAPSQLVAISRNGRFIVVESGAQNLIVDDTNSYNDIFLFDQGAV